jgi:hypothetical protein
MAGVHSCQLLVCTLLADMLRCGCAASPPAVALYHLTYGPCIATGAPAVYYQGSVALGTCAVPACMQFSSTCMLGKDASDVLSIPVC